MSNVVESVRDRVFADAERRRTALSETLEDLKATKVAHLGWFERRELHREIRRVAAQLARAERRIFLLRQISFNGL